MLVHRSDIQKLLVRLRHLKSLHIHALIILANLSSKGGLVHYVEYFQTVLLKIFQLPLGSVAKKTEHLTVPSEISELD